MKLVYAEHNVQPAITSVVPISQLDHYQNYPIIVKNLINEAHLLTQKKLTYIYNSADPKNGGMDCSGTIYYLLKNAHIDDVPRQSSDMYTWAEQKGKLYQVTSNNLSSTEFSKLRPGDLLFWSGTYAIHRDPPITHVMIYLGKNKNNKPLMFGSSNGRTYLGKKMWGVSVFDFRLPNKNSPSKFVGYSCIPHLTCKNSNGV